MPTIYNTGGNNYVEFELKSPAKISVEINGGIEGGNRHPLLIFADPMETEVYSGSSANVTYFGPGVHNVDRIEVQSNHTYYVAGGAYINGYFDGGVDKQNVKIIGRGVLAGSNYGHKAHHSIEIMGASSNLTIEGITIADSPWTNIRIYGTNNTVRNVKMIAWFHNTDGILLGENSLIEDCFFKVNDDTIKLYQSGITVRNITIWQLVNGAPIQLTWNVRVRTSNVRVSNVYVIRTEHVSDFRNKGIFNSIHGGIGHLTDYVFDNFYIENSTYRLFKLKFEKTSYNTDQSGFGRISGMTFRNITVTSPMSQLSEIYGGNAADYIKNLSFENVTVVDRTTGQNRPLSLADFSTDDISVKDIRALNLKVGATPGAQALTPAERLDGYFSTRNFDTAPKQLMYAVALYNIEGTMVDMSFVTGNVPPLTSVDLTTGLTLPASVNGYSAKTMVWDGIDPTASLMQPYAKALSIPKNQGAAVAPVISTIIPDDGKAKLTWSAATPVPDSYSVYYLQSDTAKTAAEVIAANTKLTGVTALTAEIIGLTNNKDYYFVVEAAKTGYASLFSSVIKSQPQVPVAPVLSLTAGDARLTVAWTAASPAPDSYTVYYLQSDTTKTAAEVVAGNTKLTGITALTTDIASLTNGKDYYVVVEAVKAGATSPLYSAVVKATPEAIVAPIINPITAGDARVTLAWTAANPIPDSYSVYYLQSDAAKTAAEVVAANVKLANISGLTAEITNLTNGKDYYFVVEAVKAGSAAPLYSAVVKATPAAIVAPVINPITAGDARVTVSWTAASPMPDSYSVYFVQSDTPKTAADVIALNNKLSNITTLSTEITGLTNGKDYYFVVAAVKAGSTTPLYSGVVKATPAAVAPPQPISYSITYNTNGGTLPPDVPTSYTTGSALTLAVPTRQGFNFDGWYYDSSFMSGPVGIITAADSGNKTFYAKWSAIVVTYNISYVPNGGIFYVNVPTTYTTGTQVTLPVPVMQGYTFDGWYENSAFTGSPIVYIPTGASGNKMFYAKWSIIQQPIIPNPPYVNNPTGSGSGGSSSDSDSGSHSIQSAPSNQTTAGQSSGVTVNDNSHPAVKQPDGSVLVSVSTPSVSSANSGAGTINVNIGSETHAVVSLSLDALTSNQTAANGDVNVVIQSNFGSLSIPERVISWIKAQSYSNLTVTVRKGSFIVEMKADGKAFEYNNPDMPLIIELPTTSKSSTIVAVRKFKGKDTILPYSVIKDNNVVVMSSSIGTFDIINNDVRFDDIAGHWAEDYVKFVTARRLYVGVGNQTFAPQSKMTRGMFAMVLANMEGGIADYKNSAYSDVDINAYYGKSIAWAADKNIAANTSGGNFRPYDPITREEMAAMLYNYIKYKNYSLTAVNNGTFSDIGSVSWWATEAVSSMKHYGIIAGREQNKFVPDDTATRAEVASILANFIKILICS